MTNILNRRSFFLSSAALSAGIKATLAKPNGNAAEPSTELLMIGPREGYTPQIGTLVSEMAYMRSSVLQSVRGLSQTDLDFLLDARANTIGALLLHLAATDAYYHLNTFEGKAWDSWDEKVKQKWDVPMNLGESARKAIKGHGLDYYLDALHETREATLAEFKKRDDAWLKTVDEKWQVNTYWKWFHVCEHESNHNGQIKFLKGRLPGAKPENG